jgi:hypothetical protein
MFHRAWNLSLYFGAALLLAAGALLETNLTALVALLAFLAWDVGFACSAAAFAGRSVEDVQLQVQNAREHLSYFLAFYGVLFGVLFTQSPERQREFLQLCEAAGISPTLLVVPLLLATVPLLFVPIRVTAPHQAGPSPALKALLVLNASLQKSAIFLFVHVVLRVLASLEGG